MKSAHLIAVIQYEDDDGDPMRTPIISRVFIASESPMTLTYDGSGYSYSELLRIERPSFDEAMAYILKEISAEHSWFAWVRPFLDEEGQLPAEPVEPVVEEEEEVEVEHNLTYDVMMKTYRYHCSCGEQCEEVVEANKGHKGFPPNAPY